MEHSKKDSFSQSVYYEHLGTINGVRFTPREVDIIACLLSGKATKTVAHFLSIEDKTVETHKYNIMRKLECNSKEGIISFIEKSDKFSVIKKHYLDLFVQLTFEKCLQEVLILIANNSPVCSLVYWRQEEDQAPFISQLEKHLKLAGIKVLSDVREGYKSLNHLVHKIESDPGDYVLYVPSFSLIDSLQAGHDRGTLETFPFVQKHFQKPGSVIFILKSEGMTGSLPKEIKDVGYIDFTQEEHYYLSFLDALKRVLPHIDLEEIIAGFTQQYKFIYGSSEKAFSELSRKEREEISKKTPKGGNIFLLSLKRHKRGILAVAALFLCSLCVPAFFRDSQSFPTSKLSKVPAFSPARSELLIPHKNVLLERLNLISEIDTQFKKENQDIKALSLVGIGGSGKTVIARQYARRQGGVVLEANAETKRSLRESFESFAYLLAITEEEKKVLMGLKDIRDPEEKEEKTILFVKERLKLNPGWLLIFDNVEKFQDIVKYFPSDETIWGQGKIIITTRNSNMETHSAIYRTISIKELTPEEKLGLFLKILNTKDTSVTVIEKEKAKVFLSALPSFPLDISVAAYYLKATNISYEEYIKNITAYKSEFDSVQSHILDEVGTYSKTRYKIITMSLEKIVKESKDFGETLLFISLIGPYNIPKELLDRFKNSVVIDDFIHHLKKYSLATNANIPANKLVPCMEIHRSTQDIALTYLTQELKIEKGNSLLQAIFHALDSYIDKSLEEEDFLRMKISASHAEEFVKHTNLFPDVITALLGSKLGCLYYFLNDQATAKKTIKASLKTLETHLLNDRGEGNVKVAQALLHIGNVYTELSNYEEAKRVLEKGFHIYHTAPSKDYLNVSWGLSHLANAYRRSGYYAKAKELLEESIALHTRHGSQNYGRFARMLGYLGSVYRGLGHYEKSVGVLEQSLGLYKKHFPGDHFRVGWVLCYLGNVYRKLGLYGKSIQVLEEGLAIYKKNFSENHPNVGLMLTYLGSSYRGLGNYEKAKGSLEEGLRIHEKNFKEGHERIGRILFHLGTVYRELEDYERSGALFRKALAIYGNIHGKGEIEMGRLFRKMGDIHLLEDRLGEAESLIHKSLEILKRHKHPEAYISLESLAEVSLERSRQAAKEGNNIQVQKFKGQTIDRLNEAIQVAEGHFPKGSAHIEKIRSKVNKIKEGGARVAINN
jgi:tetratricopeptide (TPR) repeat protein/DNA-binding CsgD family transcriptional regulator